MRHQRRAQNLNRSEMARRTDNQGHNRFNDWQDRLSWSDRERNCDLNRWRDDRDRGDMRDHVESSSDDMSDDDQYSSSASRPRNRHRRRIGEGEIRDADRRMEKWHLNFNGEARGRSLEDFLLKVRRLARMDRIAPDVLMQRIHTILRGEAYDWYLCYADEFLDWAHFEERIRYMYGNPNRDQGNRQKIYERKQNRNETFLSFKMEIERLNKLLSAPLDQQRIFEVIWDNMRPHYRSKLACKTVRCLRKLEYYAYRIDANDPIFRNTRDGPSRVNAVHNIEVEEKEDESYSSASDSENVNAIGAKFEKDRGAREQKTAGTNGKKPGLNSRDVGSTQLMLCWNCKKTGCWQHGGARSAFAS